MAVSDKTGNVFFIINNHNNSCNCLINGYLNNQKIEVNTVSKDDFVASIHLNHLDFIKADIEGAERLMLKEIQNTLRV